MELPREFCQRMEPLLGEAWRDFRAAYDAPLRRGVRVNTAKIAVEDFLPLFLLPLTPSPFAPDSFYLDEPHKAGRDPLHHAGAYYMQEPSAGSAVAVLSPKPGEKILDLCAAPGGKSTQIAAAIGSAGLLWSNEYVAARARILEQNLERCGVRNAVVSNADTGRLCTALEGFFDAVLVDAPCSGEGMFRKEPQALTEWSLDNIRLCAARQEEILCNAALALKPGGRLVYSTCTFAPEEDEAVIARFLHTHPSFTLEKIDVPWGSPGFSFDTIRAYTGLDASPADLTRCRRIFPHQGGEGHFIALLRRDAADITSAPLPCPPPRDANATEAAALYAECFRQEPSGDFVTVGDTVRLLPPGLPSLKGTGTVAAGVAVATVCKNRLEPAHGVFAAAPAADCRRLLSLPLTDPRLTAFLRGEEIPCDGDRGWTAVAVERLPLGFGKNAGGRLKNRYPKGLRLL